MSDNSGNEWIIRKDFNGLRIDYWLKKSFLILVIHQFVKSLEKVK